MLETPVVVMHSLHRVSLEQRFQNDQGFFSYLNAIILQTPKILV